MMVSFFRIRSKKSASLAKEAKQARKETLQKDAKKPLAGLLFCAKRWLHKLKGGHSGSTSSGLTVARQRRIFTGLSPFSAMPRQHRPLSATLLLCSKQHRVTSSIRLSFFLEKVNQH